MLQFIKSFFITSSITLLSRFFGLFRDILIANFLGANVSSDAFFVAFKLPNLFRRLFAEGAFSAGFIPSFSELVEQKKHNKIDNGKIDKFLNQTYTTLILVLVCFCVIMELFMPYVIKVFAPGFILGSEKYVLAVNLSRIVFPYIFFISMVSLFSAILNTRSYFSLSALMPVILNICMIASLVMGYFVVKYEIFEILYSNNHMYAYLLVSGCAIAGLLQFMILFFVVRKIGYRLKFSNLSLLAETKTMFARILPAALGAGVYQLNILADTWAASFLVTGSISYLFYGDRLVQLPLGVIGIAISTVLLPMLSRQIKSERQEKARDLLNGAIIFTFFFSFPSFVGLFCLAKPILTTLFFHGNFSYEALLNTSQVVQAFSVGLPAFILNKSLIASFYSNSDTKTPFKIACFSLLSNIVLLVILTVPFKHVGIALSTSISSWLSMFIYIYILNKRKILLYSKKLLSDILKLFVISTLLFAILFFIELPDNTTLGMMIINLFTTIFLFLLFYLVLCYLFRVINISLLKKMIVKK